MAGKRIYFADFRRHMDTESLKGIYLFSGAEHFLKEQGVQEILAKALPPSERSMNMEIVYAGSDVSGQDIVERAQTLPFLANCRVLVVRQIEKWRANDWSAMEAYAANPSPSSVMVLVAQEEKLKTTGLKNIIPKIMHVECYPLFDNQVPSWIERRVIEHGKRISREAVYLLLERIGQNLGELENEIVKMVQYIGATATIEAAAVLEVTGFIRTSTIHELNVALGQANSAVALSLVGSILAEGVAPQQLLGGLSWHFRNLLASCIRLEAGESADDITGIIRHPQAKREMQTQLYTYPRKAFDHIFKVLLELDVKLKTGKGNWQLWLEMAILTICQQSELVGKKQSRS